MSRVLTPYQRRIAVALLVDAVPIDVLAERLGTSRGALYKTLHPCVSASGAPHRQGLSPCVTGTLTPDTPDRT